MWLGVEPKATSSLDCWILFLRGAYESHLFVLSFPGSPAVNVNWQDAVLFHFNGFHFSQHIKVKITSDKAQISPKCGLTTKSLFVVCVPTNSQHQGTSYPKRSWHRIYVQICNAEMCVIVLPVSFCQPKVGQTFLCSIQVIHTDVLDHTTAILYVITTW